MKKTIYAISLALLLGALIIQSVWGAEAKQLTPTLESPSLPSVTHLS